MIREIKSPNKCNALESPPNHATSSPGLWKTCLRGNQSLVPKGLGNHGSKLQALRDLDSRTVESLIQPLCTCQPPISFYCLQK